MTMLRRVTAGLLVFAAGVLTGWVLQELDRATLALLDDEMLQQ